MEAMETDLRRGIRPTPDLRDACGGDLAHPPSEESGVTGDSWTSALSSDADSSPVQSTEWTNEKHNQYLDLLEKSFVNQLNHSKLTHSDLLHQEIRTSYPASEPLIENYASHDEFKVLQDGCWQMINFQWMKNFSGSHLVKRTWLRPFIPVGSVSPLQSLASVEQDTGRIYVTGAQTISGGLARTSMQHSANHTSHWNPDGRAAEVTDQNFSDGDGKRCSAYRPVSKRFRRNSADGSSKDQIVPSGESRNADASVCRDPFSRKHQRHWELSEDPD